MICQVLLHGWGDDHGRSKKKRIRRCSCRECRSHGNAEVAGYHRSINRVMVELDERSRRLFAGVLARQFGWGGIQRVREITGLTCVTIRRGVRECEQAQGVDRGRIRRPGGGRKAIEKKPTCRTAAEGIAQGFDGGRSHGRFALDAQDNSQHRRRPSTTSATCSRTPRPASGRCTWGSRRYRTP